MRKVVIRVYTENTLHRLLWVLQLRLFQIYVIIANLAGINIFEI